MDAEITRRPLCTCVCHRTVCDPECTQCDGSSATCTRDTRLRHTFDVGAIAEIDEEVDGEV